MSRTIRFAALIVGAGLIAAFGLRAPSSGPQEATAAAAVASAPQQEGKAIFEGKGNCATCHGKEGKGTAIGPDLTNGQWLTIGGTLQDISAVVRAGVSKPARYPAPMPPMGGARLNASEIDAVARYVLQIAGARD
jgi:mono/diheme cytochrome c family protein